MDGAPAWDGTERWWPAVTTWFSCVPLVVAGWLVPLPVFGYRAAAVGAVVAAVVTLACLASLSWRTRLADGVFQVGRARLPVAVIGAVDPVPAAERRAALGPQLDARAHLAIRSWVPSAVRIHLTDPHDPTPYWMVSTRHPERLAAALRAAAETTKAAT
ncbi:DUF3093 domain-containing protein [Kineococcus rubinsiae]|uniref:DUF3093 domain-containing protein n=1 Tax=Kineococcus rubinsiae TaxID=2609562 RepID=UPI00142F589D|nr:DUF3093 domain-containing protein [Kineococcus rubinsiae]NIZ92118.1 DUF3093 domain-containing protein [Kineococcus rubinsiae]